LQSYASAAYGKRKGIIKSAAKILGLPKAGPGEVACFFGRLPMPGFDRLSLWAWAPGACFNLCPGFHKPGHRGKGFPRRPLAQAVF
jgi:hypothetical protein